MKLTLIMTVNTNFTVHEPAVADDYALKVPLKINIVNMHL